MSTWFMDYPSCRMGSRKGVIHKPRGQLRGDGVSQMPILLHKPYLVKVTKKKIWPRGLWMTPNLGFDPIWPFSNEVHYVELENRFEDVNVCKFKVPPYLLEWLSIWRIKDFDPVWKIWAYSKIFLYIQVHKNIVKPFI